ncbi:reprolysin-like metallopeptidase [uncultured Polaribacter sp.]|uniref:zinc-dependent metalloprotease n=1 Tax=uncultured Polaribacter sp. TaxID=174711 RepID=UPI0026274A5F|nr:zinc-dependent metalloprotease family protein [uncultured Polaribacter sp.]
MKSKLSFLLPLIVLFFNITAVNSQEVWKKIQKENYSIQKKEVYDKENFPSDYVIFSLESELFSGKLKKTSKEESVVELPNSEGTLSKFLLKETSNFEEGLQAKFPNIKSYTAQGLDDPTAVAKISIGTDGFHAVIFSGKEETLYVDPYTKDNVNYIVYKRSSLSKVEDDFKCQVEETIGKEFTTSNFAKNADDGKLRTFRLALACSGEYAEFHLGAGQQNIPDTETEEVKKAAVLSAMNTSITRLNGVFEKDLAVKMILVSNNDEIIFLDADTDGITDGSPNTMIDEVQSICDAEIGNANYDIGHLYSVGGDGLAGLGVVCVTGQKARGVTGRSQPVGDAYDIDYVAHELGHQFGATHTQNNNCNRTDDTAVEPGSGSTIMGYAGICSPDVQSGNSNGNSDDYFHTVSIAQMWNTIESSGTCASETDTNNTAPTADAGLDYSIPKSTPFKLSGVADDVDGTSSLTYNWEQLDNETATMPPLSSSTIGPVFRSLPSKTTPIRFMPDLATVIAGSTSSTWEVVPSVARELNFSFLVRDNHAGGGSSARDDMVVTVTDADAFTVDVPNSAVIWDVGTTQTVTWQKGTTDISPISCSFVNIKLSVDGGLTFPIVLKNDTPNDGSEDIIIPNNATEEARIMVEASDNIFYNVNSANFTINSTLPTFLITAEIDSETVCNSGNNSVDYSLNFDFINNFSETVTLSASGFPTGANVNFSSETITDDGSRIMTISNLDDKAAQDYTIIVSGNSTSLNQEIEVYLKVVSSDFNEVILSAPEDNSEDFELEGSLNWSEDSNAESYNVEVALDSDFNDLVFSNNVNTNTVQITPSLNQETTYFWRVQYVNSCGTGTFSDSFSFTTLSCDVCESFGDNQYATSTTLVEFNTINNASEKEGDNEAYGDFKSIETSVTINESYELSVNVNTDGDYRVHTKAWIDWNRNCVFDENEEYDLGFAENTTDGVTNGSPITIQVPEDAKIGATILRVSSKYTDPDVITYPLSCEQGFDGEVEDYSILVRGIVIEDDVFESFNLFPNPTDGTFNLSFDTENRDDVSVHLYDLAGRLIDSQVFNNTSTYFTKDVAFSVGSSGLYLLKITNGDKYSTRKLIIK